jgi:CheY-like chemotaxis protein
VSRPPLCEADNVLVVDDEAFCRQIVARFLRELGNPNAVVVKNGAEAVSALVAPAMNYRLVISDFNMPVKSGLELLKFIRTSTSLVPHDLPFVMLTGLADRAVVGAALALDVDAFVVKPVSKASLESRVGHALAEGRTVKPPTAYAGIDVTTPFADILKNDPLAPNPVKPAAEMATPAPSGRRVRLEEVQAGAVLSQEIRAPSGELLLASGVALSPRLISRLRDMASLRIPIDAVWVLT